MHPLLKWPGGKHRLLPYLTEYIPSEYNTYYESFLGGAALLFNQKPSQAVVSDVNEELINFYQVVQSQCEMLLNEFEQGDYENTKERYLEIRALDRDIELFGSLSEVERAARFLYLNKTCFNGLQRVNSKNQFNTPYGQYTNPKIVDADNLRKASEFFQSQDVKFQVSSYVDVLKEVEGHSNFVYLDPPYIPLTPTSSFTSYTAAGFNEKDQRQLRDLAAELDEQGNFVLLSNSDTEFTRELYEDFHLHSIRVQRSLSANAASRVKVGELLIVGPTLHAALKKQVSFYS